MRHAHPDMERRGPAGAAMIAARRIASVDRMNAPHGEGR